MAARNSFAHLTPERRREISAMGGRAVHAQGKGRQFTQAEAVAAAKKSGFRVAREVLAAKRALVRKSQ